MVDEANMKKPLCKARNPAFLKLYATNILVDETDVDIRIYFMNEIISTKEQRLAVSDGVAMISKQAAILLYEQLDTIIKKWAEEGRPVEVPEARRSVLKEMKAEEDQFVG
ncbi:MAG: DUF3467 domain-containing protein [Methanomassiliicoccales archaeon]